MWGAFLVEVLGTEPTPAFLAARNSHVGYSGALNKPIDVHIDAEPKPKMRIVDCSAMLSIVEPGTAVHPVRALPLNSLRLPHRGWVAEPN